MCQCVSREITKIIGDRRIRFPLRCGLRLLPSLDRLLQSSLSVFLPSFQKLVIQGLSCRETSALPCSVRRRRRDADRSFGTTTVRHTTLVKLQCNILVKVLELNVIPINTPSSACSFRPFLGLLSIDSSCLKRGTNPLIDM
jgi:hypothetical protein